jgi:hypothetical protein
MPVFVNFLSLRHDEKTNFTETNSHMHQSNKLKFAHHSEGSIEVLSTSVLVKYLDLF